MLHVFAAPGGRSHNHPRTRGALLAHRHAAVALSFRADGIALGTRRDLGAAPIALAHVGAQRQTMRVSSSPRPSIHTFVTSPRFRKMPLSMPTPAGVPVRITSPGYRSVRSLK